MTKQDVPKLIDWEDQLPRHRRFIGISPDIMLGGLLIGGALGYPLCYPNAYRMQDYYTCSPKYICQPVPYWPGL